MHALLPCSTQLHTVMLLDVNPVKDAPAVKQCAMGLMWSAGPRLVRDPGTATCCSCWMGRGLFFTFFFTLGACQRATARQGPHVSFYSGTTAVRGGRRTRCCRRSFALSAVRPLPSGGKMAAAAAKGGGAAARPESVIQRLLLLLFPPCRRGGAPGRGLHRSRPLREPVGPGCGAALHRPPSPAAGSAPFPFSPSCSELRPEVGAAAVLGGADLICGLRGSARPDGNEEKPPHRRHGARAVRHRAAAFPAGIRGLQHVGGGIPCAVP